MIRYSDLIPIFLVGSLLLLSFHVGEMAGHVLMAIR